MNTNDKKFLAQKIRTQYTEKQTTELDELRALDRAVKRPVSLFSYVFGSLGAVIMGSGMSLIMTDIGATLGLAARLVPGILIGVAGLAIAVANYPLHKRLLEERKKQYAAKIIELSDKLLAE